MNREEKLFKLRENMLKAGVSAVIIPSTDPHSSEYVHPHWKSRGWISGFDGSAGTLVVTKDASGLWTDFRYYIAAADCIKGSEIKLFKDGTPGVDSISDYLSKNLSSGDVVGIDGSLFPTSRYESLKKDLSTSHIDIDITFDPVSYWSDRPKKPMSAAYELDVKYCGESRESKITRVRKIMEEKNVDSYVISSLADIAWLLNIRGTDVDFTPLVVSYFLLSKDSATLFIDKAKLPLELKESLNRSGIDTLAYINIADSLGKLKSGTTLYYMPESINCYLSGVIPESVNVKKGLDITSELKSIKNKTELKNIRIAMEKDGVALVRFYKSFALRAKTETFTEFSLAKPLREARLSMEGCVDESFGPIVGYHENGALCHYSAEEKSAKKIGNSGLLLIDSGGQYYEGTTDITRTISMGNATEEEILHYTLVLRGHIRLSKVIYPEGTTGHQLDVLAREPLWSHGLNFGHGTGHGVGYFLGVHEGPQNISTRYINAPLKEGMITSNEPGLYIEGKHGIRIENLVLTTFAKDGLDQKFLGFETLTLCPYDRNLINPDLLLPDELDWINNYHKEVQKRLEPYLEPDEIKWLSEKTREI